MISSPLVSVEGTLARPRATPLDGVPPFGREWTFHGMSGARSGRRCLATLTTSCIDVDAPHRTCRWQPLSVTPLTPASSANAPAIAPGATRQSIERAAGRRTHDRRALRAAGWSIGALALIGWLVAVHEPFPVFTPAPAPAIHAAGAVRQHVVHPAGTARVAAIERAAPASAPAQQVAAHPVATSSRLLSHARGAAPKKAARRADAASAVQRVATVSRPLPPSPHQPSDKLTTPRRASPHAAARLDAGSPVTQHASRAPSRNHLDRRSQSHAPQHPLDDPLTLIAMAHALDAARPAQPEQVPGAGFDWTAQRSHRRLTDARGTLPR